MARHDQFFPADINGDGRTDLFAWNFEDWATEYLGRMVSSGNSLTANFIGDWVENGTWVPSIASSRAISRATHSGHFAAARASLICSSTIAIGSG